jgi:hypothetical protein
MATPAFLQAYQAYGLTSRTDIARVTSGTIIKIIQHDATKIEEFMAQSWVQSLLAEGIDVSPLTCPCILHPVEGSKKKQSIAHIEVRHVFSEWMWKKVEAQPTAAAIAISHIRALHEALETNPTAELIIVLEGDVKANENTEVLLAGVIANFHGNDAVKDTQYIALTYSDWHPKHGKNVRTKQKRIEFSKMHPYFSLNELPFEANRSGHWEYSFVGQGARALAFRRAFAQTLTTTRVDHFWDLHILKVLSGIRNDMWKAGEDATTLALLADPTIFSHIPEFGKRFRGSGRLETEAANTAEEEAYYICIDLDAEWGFCNRVQTLALLFGICSFLRLGVYVLWTQRKACDTTLERVVKFDETSDVWKKLPFVKVFSDRTDSSWRAAKCNTVWCRGIFNSQCCVSMGLTHFFQEVWSNTSLEQQAFINQTAIPELQTKLTEEYCWSVISVPAEIEKKANKYMNDSRSNSGLQAAFHVRRGDHAYMNWHQKIKETKDDGVYHMIDSAWKAADDAFEEPIQGRHRLESLTPLFI